MNSHTWEAPMAPQICGLVCFLEDSTKTFLEDQDVIGDPAAQGLGVRAPCAAASSQVPSVQGMLAPQRQKEIHNRACRHSLRQVYIPQPQAGLHLSADASCHFQALFGRRSSPPLGTHHLLKPLWGFHPSILRWVWETAQLWSSGLTGAEFHL